jgi:hypothetical protein
MAEQTKSNLDKITDTLEETPVKSSGQEPRKTKEVQLDRISKATNPLSITTVDDKSAGTILKTAVENLSKDLETWSSEEKESMKDLVKEIAKLSEKNIEEWNKGIKQVIAEAKKGLELAKQSGNKDAERAFGNTVSKAKEEHFRVNGMGLRGKEDTFANRLGQSFGLKNPDGTPKLLNDKNTGFLGNIKAIGTASAKGFGSSILGGAKSVFKGDLDNPGIRTSLFRTNKERRVHEREKQGWAPEAEQLSDLTEPQKKMLADKGIAPASDKDISYRKDGKPVSLKDINAELEAAANIAKPVTDTGSDMQEVAAGLADSPVVDAIEAQTTVIKDISDTAKQTHELIDAIKKAIDKLAENGAVSGSVGEDSGGNMLPDIDIDLPGRRNRRNGGPQSRSERARSQPRDAKGRFVRRTPDATPGGRIGRGRGILGGLALAGTAVGLTAASNDNDSPTSIASNTAMTAAEVADVGSSGTKTPAKAAEKGAVKAGEKVAGKGVAKVGAKAVGKSLLKKIPGVSILAGGAFATQRAMQGDWLGAAGELASGVAGTIPGLGTAASVGIDAALAARDMGALGGVPGTQATSAAPAAGAPAQGAVAGKPGGGIFSRAAGFVKKNPLMAAAGLGGVGLAAVGASKAWDWMTGGDEKKVESGQNPDSGILEQGSEAARDQMQVNVPPPTVIQQGGNTKPDEKSSGIPSTPTYTRDDENSWMRFALKRAMA